MLATVMLEKIFYTKEKDHAFFSALFMVFSAACLLSLSAQLSFPLQPVPLSFQSITVIMIGWLLGVRLGVYAVITYLIAGAMGLPIFADGSSGMAVFFGPTVGYLIGFLPAVWLSGTIFHKGSAYSLGLRSGISAIVGISSLFSLGILFLAQFVGWEKAWLLGVKPFLWVECLKIMVASLLVSRLKMHG